MFGFLGRSDGFSHMVILDDMVAKASVNDSDDEEIPQIVKDDDEVPELIEDHRIPPIVEKRSYPKSYKWDVNQKNYAVSFKEIIEIQKGDEIELVLEKDTVHLQVRYVLSSNPGSKKPSLPFKLKYTDLFGPEVCIQLNPDCSYSYTVTCDKLFKTKPMPGKGTLDDPFQIDELKLHFLKEDVQKLEVGSFVRITADKTHDRKESTIRITEIESYKRTFPKGGETIAPVSKFEFDWSQFTKPFSTMNLRMFKEFIIRSDRGGYAFDVQLKYEEVATGPKVAKEVIGPKIEEVD